MALLTEDIKKRFTEIGKQTYEKDPTVVAKLHDPFTEATWYLIEYNIENDTGYGFRTGVDVEGDGDWGYFSMQELEEMELEVQLDITFTECLFSEVAPEEYMIANDIPFPSPKIECQDYPEYEEYQHRLAEINEMRREQEADRLDGWER